MSLARHVVHGDEDPFFPHGSGVALAAEIPGAIAGRSRPAKIQPTHAAPGS